MKNKAIGLFSGGLDSCLAVKVILEQGIEVIAMVCDLWRHPEIEGDDYPLRKLAESLGAVYLYEDLSDDYPELLHNPRWGYGTAVNPCIDCKYLMMKRAAKRMKEMGASFVFTGEVLGQRPMTQNRKSMDMLLEKSGLGGRLVRPLSAKHLPPTIPEEEGILDRSKLLDIRGRSRERQIALAEEYGITEYGAPGGGCILTEREYGAKVQDFLQNPVGRKMTPEDLELFRTGRHFRLSPDVKMIMGKNHEENLKLAEYAEGRISITTGDVPGPFTLMEGKPDDKTLKLAGGIIARYAKKVDPPELEMEVRGLPGVETLSAEPLDDKAVQALKVRFSRGKLEEYRRNLRNGK